MIAFIVVDVVEVIRAGWPALRSNALGLRHFGNSAARHRRRIPRTGSAVRSYDTTRCDADGRRADMQGIRERRGVIRNGDPRSLHSV
jgi:hypothetical protein